MLSSKKGAAGILLGIVIGLIFLKGVVACLTKSLSILAQNAPSSAKTENPNNLVNFQQSLPLPYGILNLFRKFAHAVWFLDETHATLSQ